MKLSIVILNWNGREMLRTYLPSVVQNTTYDGVEVVVADNGSGDDSIEMLCREFPSVRIVALDENYGFAEGYNRALRQLSADYYLLLNSDVEVRDKDWLTPLFSYMDEHPDCAACQPKMLSLLNPDTFEYAGAAGGFVDYFGYPYCRGRLLNKIEKDHGQYDTIQSILWGSGAALFVRAKDYWNAGGLDNSFFAHMEEIDLCWRLRQLGRDVVCVPQSRVYHLGGGTLNKENPHKTYLNFRNNLILLYKNLPSESRLWTVFAMRFVLDTLTAIAYLLTGGYRNTAAVFRAYRDFIKLHSTYGADRRKNMRRRVVKSIPEATDKLLFVEYIKLLLSRGR